MNDTLVYTLPQWFIFAAIIAVSYGWIEDKKSFRIIGELIFVALGVFSLIILSGNYFAAKDLLSAEEIVSRDLDDEIIDKIPIQAKLFPAYLSFVAAGTLGLLAAFFDIKNNRKYRWVIVLAGLTALYGFFAIIGAVGTL